MKDKTELIVLVVVLVLIYTRPSALVRFSSSLVGKVIFLAAVIISSLISPLSGLLIATLMVMLMEQNYEGFKEGNDATSGSISATVVGEHSKDATMLLVKSDGADITEDIVGNYELADSSNIAKHTMINNVLPCVTITLASDIPVDDITSTTTFAIYSDADGADGATAGADGADGSATAGAVDGSTTDAADGTSPVSTESEFASGTYAMDSDPSGAVNKLSLSDLNYVDSTNTIADLPAGAYIRIQGSDTKYDIDSADNTTILTLSSGLIGTIADGTSITIQEHTHVHQHTTESFEGMDGEEAEVSAEADAGGEADAGEEKDDEDKEEVMNPGLSKLIKEATDKINDIKTEGFFSGKEKKSEVVGAYAGETYETEITGITAVCTTPRCERIHREEQLIRPVNSNELL